MAVPWGACCEQVGNDRFLSGVLLATNVSVRSSRRESTCTRSYCTMTGTGTEIETEGSDRGGRKELEGVPSPVCFLYGSLHLTRECTPDISLLGFLSLGWCFLYLPTSCYLFGVNLYVFSLISAKLLIYSPPLFPHPSPVLASLSL